MTDPIADFLTTIRNAIMAARDEVNTPSSKIKVEIARILKEQGYIDGYEVRSEEEHVGPRLIIALRYTEKREPVITGLKRISRPGQRIYIGRNSVPKVLGGMGTAIVSTSHGMMTGHDARQEGVGGEVIAEVW